MGMFALLSRGKWHHDSPLFGGELGVVVLPRQTFRRRERGTGTTSCRSNQKYSSVRRDRTSLVSNHLVVDSASLGRTRAIAVKFESSRRRWIRDQHRKRTSDILGLTDFASNKGYALYRPDR